MTRSYRTKNHDLENLPRNFGKSSATTVGPHKTKKNGAGRGNWGADGAELEDVKYNPAKPRRRSNVSVHLAGGVQFRSKFEEVEDEPVFIERIHGPASVPFPAPPAAEDSRAESDGVIADGQSDDDDGDGASGDSLADLAAMADASALAESDDDGRVDDAARRPDAGPTGSAGPTESAGLPAGPARFGVSPDVLPREMMV